MEEKEEKKEISEIKSKRRVSLFKRRRKPDIRPFVREAKYQKFKKTLIRLLLITVVLFAIVLILWSIRFIVLPYIFTGNNSVIVRPTTKNLSPSGIIEEITNSGFDAEDIQVSNDLTHVTFKIHRETQVIMDPRRNLKEDLVILRAIMNEMVEGNKRAIYIDLRFNKPIVKF